MLVYLYRYHNLHIVGVFRLLIGLKYDQWHLSSEMLFMEGMQSPGLRRFLVSRFLHAMVYTDVPQIPTTDTWWSQSARNLVTCLRLPHRPQLVSQSAANQTFFALRVTMGQNNNNGVFMKPCQALLITAHPQSRPHLWETYAKHLLKQLSNSERLWFEAFMQLLFPLVDQNAVAGQLSLQCD